MPEESLTPAPWSLYELRRRWNQAKGQVAPWWPECSKEAYNTGLDQLARALGNWSDARRGGRAGGRVGFARFKSRRSARAAVRFTTGAMRVEPDRKHVRLPRLGAIKLHESARKLARRIEAGTARIGSATVSRDSRGRWHVAFTCEITRAAGRPSHVGPAGKVVGVDVGVASLAVLSHAVPGLTDACGKVANPRRLAGVLGRLRRAQRRAARQVGPYDPASRSRQAPCARWGKTWRRVARLHGQVRDARADGWHQLTTALAQRFDTVVVEDLNVAGMLTRPAPKPDGKGGHARNAPGGQTRPGPVGSRRRASPTAPPTRLQDHLVRLGPARGRAVLPLLQDLLAMPDSAG